MQKQQDQSVSDQIVTGFKGVQQFLKDRASRPANIIALIEEDHGPLKELIKVMKDSDRSLSERSLAFSQFAPLLMTHAKSEEQSLYEFMKTNEDLRELAFEGDTEHTLADQMTEEIKRTTDQDQLGARIKVLAELVEHHIKEEESELLPEVKKQVNSETLVGLSNKYISVQEMIISEGQDDSPRESEIVQ